MHVGLGTATGADVRVLWAGGESGPGLHVDADTFAVVTRGATAVRHWATQ